MKEYVFKKDSKSYPVMAKDLLQAGLILKEEIGIGGKEWDDVILLTDERLTELEAKVQFLMNQRPVSEELVAIHGRKTFQDIYEQSKK